MCSTRFLWLLVLLPAVSLAWASDPDESGTQNLRSQIHPSPDTTLLGVVWTPPVHPDSALRALDRMHAVGATTVRVTRLPSDTIAARADTLGLRLYVDLPVSHVSAPRLPEALARAAPALERLFSLARRHPSITHVGLARSVDTTVPSTCITLDRWTQRIHAQNSSLRTYYVTPFSADADQCVGSVDLPLLDVRDQAAPVARWLQWESQTDQVGLGTVGTWVRPGAPPGLQVPHSPERQARHLERVLSRLLDSTRTSPPVVFVSRWRDRSSSLMPSRRYGLHDATGQRRPAAGVVSGFYSGTQTVFAFPTGDQANRDPSLLAIFAWGLLAVIGVIYAQSLFVRRTVARYFTAHGFYVDAVRQGRDLHPGLTGVLLCVVATSLGGAGALTAQVAGSHAITGRALEALSPEIGSALAHAVERPAVAGFVVGGIALALVLLWTGILLVVARRWSRFTPSQALVLAVWPAWPGLLPLPLALATGPESPISPSLFGFSLLGGGTLALVYYTLAVVSDYHSVTDVPWPIALLLAGLSPLVLLAFGLVVLNLQYEIPFAFLCRLATQT